MSIEKLVYYREIAGAFRNRLAEASEGEYIKKPRMLDRLGRQRYLVVEELQKRRATAREMSIR